MTSLRPGLPAVLCAGLACLFFVSAVVLVIVLMRRNTRGG
jgi:hypothetical protein